MSKDRQKRPAAKDYAGVVGDRTGESDCPVIVVGIGSAAAGTNSLKRLFNKIPAGHGMAFVVIQHCEPAYENLSVRLLKDQTALPVVEAADGMPVLADHVYLLPPEKFLNITGSRLTLQEPVHCNGLLMPIDHFFCSLAADQRHRGCGILLSGTGGDGILGLSEIKAAGGGTLAEAPGGAEFSGVAQSAINAVVDAVLPIEAMVEAVVALAEQVQARTANEPSESPEFDAHLRAILDILRAKVGHDFRCYKPNTLVRRIRRRMTLGKIATFAAYAEFLREHLGEVSFLQKDLLIGVTEFFRQPQAWQILEEKVMAPLVDNAKPGTDVRVWVPGCSTGKEAYSLAMLLAEQVEKSGKKINVQIFATDSDLAALAAARSGSYSKEEIGENLSPERQKRFFARKDGLYQIAKAIREQVVFAPQNLIADPPFSRLDLISCRNLLIYLDQQVQKKIIPLFHFSLREGGFLFLGNAETVGDREDLFEPVSKKWRIYRRIGLGRPGGVEIPVCPAGETLAASSNLPVPAASPRMSLTSVAQQMLLHRFAPASVMIDRRLQVVYVHGAVEDYLTIPAGELTTRVVDMAREGLRARLRGAIDKCLEISRPVSVTARVLRGQRSAPVKATVAPLRYPREADGLMLITFQDHRLSVAKSRGPAGAESEAHQLQDELKVTREELQSTIEQLEASNDQLKVSNEEVTATNEELQSANEEMETSKEELQSLNEELNTINARLHEKVEELESTNNDILNLLSSTNIATVFLDKELRIRRYTPASTTLFSLIPSDAGRPIGGVLRHFSDETFLDDARRVLAVLAPLAKEVQAEDGRWYIRRITPYRTQDDRIEGVVVTFVDVCELKETEETLRQQQAELQAARAEAETARRRLAVIVDSIADGFFAFDRKWRITHVNDAALRHFRKTREEMVGRGFFEVFPAARGTSYEAEYRRSMESGEPVHFEAPSTILDRMMELHAYPGPDNMTILFRDVTERNRMGVALQEAHERAAWLARFPEENPNPVVRVSLEGNVLYRNPASTELPGWGCEVGQPLPAPLLPLVGQAMTKGKEAEQDVELGGRFYSVSVSPSPVEQYANVYGRDITERKRAEAELKEATNLVQQHAAQLDAILGTMTDPLLFFDPQGRPRKINNAAAALLGIDRDIDRLDEPALMAIWESKKYRDLDGRPMSLDEMPYRRALNGETVRGQAMRLTARDGREAIVEVNAEVLESNGRRDGVVVVWHDITERKRAEERLRKNEQLLKDVIDGSTSPIFLKDLDGKFITINASLERMLGKSREEIKDKTDYDIAPKEVADYWRTHDKRVMATGKAIQIEEVADLPDGNHIFLANKFPLVDADGQIYGVGAISLDITERKRAEEAVRKSDARLNTAIESVREGVIIATKAGEVIYWNPAAQVMHGFANPGEGIGPLKETPNTFDLIMPDTGRVLPLEEWPMPRIMRGESVRNFELRLRRPDQGWERFVSYSGAMVETASGEPLVFLSVYDLTERKQMEEELRRSHDELEARVQERTEELAGSHQRLQELAAQLLQAQEKERKRVAVELHDSLLSELAAMKFLFEAKLMLLKKGRLADTNDFDRVTDIMQKVIKDARGIMNNLRPSILDEMGVLPTIDWVSREYQKTYGHIQVRKQVEVLEEDIPEILKVVIFRVLQEALNNFARHGRGDLVDLSLGKSGNTLHLRIQDNGQGFDVGKVRKGVGLESMRERVELSGGSFVVESTEGGGTTIRASWSFSGDG